MTNEANRPPKRRVPVGVEPFGSRAHARVWAPEHARVEIAIEGRRVALEPELGGYWSGWVEARAGARYGFHVDGGPLLPDPASRHQPEGPHAASAIVDPSRFAWTDARWRGRSLREAVVYEMHVGTFTRAGTWRAASEHIAELAELGITVIEMMPIAEFPGAFGWGYDGVSLFAPYHGYGEPDDLRAFVDRAHACGVAVILDVVYNHFGPDGNYLARFSSRYFTDRHATDWGAAIDYDGPESAPVRELVVSNAAYWIDEHRFDGLRLDATQNVYDFRGREHVIAEIVRAVREAGRGRTTLVVAENETQDRRLLLPRERGGWGLDAVWNDDFHHSAIVALTGRCEAYYSDHRGTAQELASALEHGWLFQGQRYGWQRGRRGSPARGIDPSAFVTFLENHDHVASTLDGRRLSSLTAPAKHRAATALVLLGPGTPMLFQGEEIGSSAPFLFFADHRPGLAELVKKGRAGFLAQFPSIAVASSLRLDDPGSRATFERCVVDRDTGAAGAAHREMVRALLALRRNDAAISGVSRCEIDSAVIAEDAFVLRYFTEDGEDRLIVVNLGPDRSVPSIPEPLVAPPPDRRWRTIFASEDPRYGGRGAPPFEDDDGVHLAAHCTLLLAPEAVL